MSEPGTAKVEASPCWQLARLAVVQEIELRGFLLLEWLTVALILRESFGRGRTKAYIPTLKLFEQFLSGARRKARDRVKRGVVVKIGGVKLGRVTRGCVCERLRDLKAARVIVEEPEHWYAINPVFEDWAVPRRPEAFEVFDTGALFDEKAEFPQLRDEVREVFVESFARPAAPGAEDMAALSRDVATEFRAGSAAVRSEGERRSGDVRPAGEPAPESGSPGGPPDPRGVLGAAADREIERVAAAAQGGTVPNFGTFQILERAAEAAAKVSPRYPPSKAVNVKRSTLTAEEASGMEAEPMRITAGEAARLLGMVAEFVGAAELEPMTRGGSREAWERIAGRYPAETECEAKWGLYLVQTRQMPAERSPGVLTNRGAWLNNRIARAAGLKSLSGLKWGPWREEP